MNENQKENFNLQVRKLLKQFGVKSHQLIEKRFIVDKSDCKVTLTLEVDNKKIETLEYNIKID